MGNMPSDESAPTIYSDAVRVSVSPATVTFVFSRAESWMTPAIERDLVRVQMSPTHFKIMMRVLPDILSQYEANFGEIPIQGMEIGLTMDRTNPSESEES